MTWKGKSPVVELVTTDYPLGVKLPKKAMDHLEKHLQRLPDLKKWIVKLSVSTAIDLDAYLC